MWGFCENSRRSYSHLFDLVTVSLSLRPINLHTCTRKSTSTQICSQKIFICTMTLFQQLSYRHLDLDILVQLNHWLIVMCMWRFRGKSGRPHAHFYWLCDHHDCIIFTSYNIHLTPIYIHIFRHKFIYPY